MELVKVESSNINAIGYDGGLIVEYKSGVKYKYDAPEEIYTQLVESMSKGSFMNQKVKGVYNYTKLENK